VTIPVAPVFGVSFRPPNTARGWAGSNDAANITHVGRISVGLFTFRSLSLVQLSTVAT
jgi:hypothetical protein